MNYIKFLSWYNKRIDEMSGLAVCPDDIWNYFENDLEEDKKDEFLRDNAEFNQNNNNQKYE